MNLIERARSVLHGVFIEEDSFQEGCYLLPSSVEEIGTGNRLITQVMNETLANAYSEAYKGSVGGVRFYTPGDKTDSFKRTVALVYNVSPKTIQCLPYINTKTMVYAGGYIPTKAFEEYESFGLSRIISVGQLVSRMESMRQQIVIYCL